MVTAGRRRVTWLMLCLAVVLVAAVAWGCRARSDGAARGAPLRVGAYFAPWDESRGVSSLRLSSGLVDEFSPVWYTPTPTGGVVPSASRGGQRTSAAAIADEVRARGMRVVPVISNFRGGRWDADLISMILQRPDLRRAHVAALTDLVVRERWHGIDLDYESLHAGDRGAYAALVRDLGAALDRVGKQLTVTVQAKTSEPGAASFQRAQDYRAIGRAADQVVVMAYDYSWSTSEPGPIAPIGWVRDVLRFTVREIPREKVLLGVATHGYDWVGARGTDLMASDAVRLARAHGAKVRWDRASRSPWFAYTDREGRRHTVCFENARSLREKLRLAERTGVRGVKIWKMGGEDPDIWLEIRDLRVG